MKRPIIIGIGGSHSKSGKTTLAVALLNRLKGWGAVKYTKTAIYSSIIDDRDILSVKGKDTRRFLDSGASAVLWVQSPASGLNEVMPLAMDKLSHLEGIIVEGNSAIEFLKPDIIIFITGKDSSRIKESGKRILDSADIIYYSDKKEIIVQQAHTAMARGNRIIHGEIEKVASIVFDMIDLIKRVEKLLVENALNGRILCSVARGIAEDMGVSYEKIGEIADEIGIKITNCELGCF
ncbi:MAG: hypothetical protein ACK4Z9_05315 [Thermodesulfovibrionales bacterium]